MRPSRDGRPRPRARAPPPPGRRAATPEPVVIALAARQRVVVDLAGLDEVPEGGEQLGVGGPDGAGPQLGPEACAPSSEQLAHGVVEGTGRPDRPAPARRQEGDLVGEAQWSDSSLDPIAPAPSLRRRRRCTARRASTPGTRRPAASTSASSVGATLGAGEPPTVSTRASTPRRLAMAPCHAGRNSASVTVSTGSTSDAGRQASGGAVGGESPRRTTHGGRRQGGTRRARLDRRARGQRAPAARDSDDSAWRRRARRTARAFA